MIWWHGVLLVALAVAVGLWAGWSVGRSDTKLGCAPKLDEQDETSYRLGHEEGLDEGYRRLAPIVNPAGPEASEPPAGDWRDQMAHDLAPGELDERPASDTEQFRAIFGSADRLRREVWLCWDARLRSEHEWDLLKRESGVLAA